MVKSGNYRVTAAKEKLPQATIVEFDDEGQTAQELKSGRAQALVSSAPYPGELAARNPKEIYLPVEGVFTKEPCGLALNPKDREALPALNAWVAPVSPPSGSTPPGTIGSRPWIGKGNSNERPWTAR